MKTLRLSFLNRRLLVPVILTVSLFLVCLGMRPPTITKAAKSKGVYRAVVETQIKAAKTGIEKNGQAFKLCRRPDLIEPPSFHVSPFTPESNSSIPTVVFLVTSRGPPVSCV